MAGMHREIAQLIFAFFSYFLDSRLFNGCTLPSLYSYLIKMAAEFLQAGHERQASSTHSVYCSSDMQRQYMGYYQNNYID